MLLVLCRGCLEEEADVSTGCPWVVYWVICFTKEIVKGWWRGMLLLLLLYILYFDRVMGAKRTIQRKRQLPRMQNPIAALCMMLGT